MLALSATPHRGISNRPSTARLMARRESRTTTTRAGRALSDLASANDLCPETASGMDFVELAARLLPLAPDSNARRQALKVLEEAGPGFWGENDD
jgi:hypothetical protein